MSTVVRMASDPPNTGPSAFDALFRECADDVCAYAWSLLHDRAAAEEVTAAAFERAFRKQDRFDPSKGTRRAWLFGIARHAALDELRRRRRTRAFEADPADPRTAEAVDRSGEEADRRAAVRAALAALEPRDRELIALKFHAGLSNAEVADVLGISATNAGTRLHRAVTKLRESLA